MLLNNKNRASPFKTGFFVGFAQVCLVVEWAILPFPEFAMYIVIGLVMVIGGLWGVVAWLSQKLLNSRWFILTPCVIVISEYVRCHNPFFCLPYNVTADILYPGNFYFMQLAEYLGIYGLCLMLCYSSLFLAWIIYHPSHKKIVYVFGYTSIIFALHYWGYVSLRKLDSTTPLNIGIVHNKQTFVQAVNRKQNTRSFQKNITFVASQADVLFFPENFASYYNFPVGKNPFTDRTSSTEIFEDVCGISWEKILSIWKKHRVPLVGGVYVYKETTDRTAIFSLPACQYNFEKHIRDKCFLAPIQENTFWEKIPVENDTTLKSPRHDAIISVADTNFAVCLCIEQMIPNIWKYRNVESMKKVDIQVCLANMEGFSFSPWEREQSTCRRSLMAIQHRRPFLYVENGCSQYFDANGRLIHSSGEEEVVWRVTR